VFCRPYHPAQNQGFSELSADSAYGFDIMSGNEQGSRKQNRSNDMSDMLHPSLPPHLPAKII
jgi:hypothetical protein